MSRASDRAYTMIRGLILSGELAPGAQLGEEALAELCDVSRTPIRDALRRLEADLLIRRTGTQRSFVADWSLADVEDAFELRGMLEAHAALRACQRMDDEALARLRRCNARIRRAIERAVPDVSGFMNANREFHGVILEQARSRRLTALLGTLVEQPVVRRTAEQYSTAQLSQSWREHDELIAAFERRDGVWAQAVMLGHIRRAFHAYADAHKRQAPDGAGDVSENCIQNGEVAGSGSPPADGRPQAAMAAEA
ncbi:GntR family transcriptional regulator [Novosphingobium piscinae]|uniref:GntR family transcriptional regulator n=1 Tax=Novosphingobium piscinae TaxID=1507448 RepID=A0A7X1FVZ7_9SPHN|nr:GntR family transcriptional regulator [Novosphingobium piscinae]MBC2667966.1 GntR family transcriptional regulator [Novosphingobium piscinae]